MASSRRDGFRWWIFFACTVLGTFLGIFFQRFDVTASLFRNLIDLGFDLKDLNLLAADLGFRFYLHMNLGTFLGGAVGLWLAR
jgi:hypothetical protein